MTRLTRIRRALSVLMLGGAGLAGTTGCDQLLPLLPELGFCGQTATPSELAKLAEGPALFIDALHQVALEVGGQSSEVGNGLNAGLDLKGQALEALGPYAYEGQGTYEREVASDRAFRLRFFYGDGVAGKTAGAPLEADLTKIESYLPNLLNPLAGQGPLFPLVEATGLTSGSLQFRDDALRFDLGSLLSTTLKGYDLQLSLGTTKNTPGELIRQVQDRKLSFSLEDTRMARPDMAFNLTIKRFDLTYGLDGEASLGGDYLFEVENGPLSYYGAVKTVEGAPFASLRCGPGEASEFATLSFAEGRADFRMSGENFPITLPGLAPRQ